MVPAGAGESDSRISAAVGSGFMPRRRRNPVTPASRALSAQRRVAERSRETRRISQIAAPTFRQESAASKAHSASSGVRTATLIR